jgi:hypothetical protein
VMSITSLSKNTPEGIVIKGIKIVNNPTHFSHEVILLNQNNCNNKQKISGRSCMNQ